MFRVIVEVLRRWRWPLFTALGMLLLWLLWLSPVERTLGQTVKLVYLHGALVRTATILLAISLPLNLLAVFSVKEGWLGWGKSLTWTALAIWILHTLVSMITTYAAWGIFIAWYEPRTRFTFIFAGVGVVVVLVAYLINDSRFTALAFALLAGLTLLLLPRLGFIQHPLDPIGTSPSNAIRWFYGAILAVSLGMAGLLAFWLRDRVSLKPGA